MQPAQSKFTPTSLILNLISQMKEVDEILIVKWMHSMRQPNTKLSSAL
jgi:hypothetical protein